MSDLSENKRTALEASLLKRMQEIVDGGEIGLDKEGHAVRLTPSPAMLNVIVAYLKWSSDPGALPVGKGEATGVLKQFEKKLPFRDQTVN